ncbi:class I SAM-dependent methyltransferase [Occallatibacter riparius]|uniref:Class I SAM-dependent methyltransferase n=1 Tax=Occallatibacter riparius TaxID=1002689 RepID=A0A9J7BL96_9BACT|nr:class I SAM-dependent methyltransferase [Occallatibacter riparius]UWZ82013.1 class I SAM-dependent methyltransferase [Occallatibacter riparius]
MREKIADFYEPLAAVYHLIFEDWDASIARQAKVVDRLIRNELGQAPLRILDCACGIGTQAIGLAQLGHLLTASDVCDAAVERAQKEAQQRGLTIAFHVSDMTGLREIEESGFDAVVALDNALPHLEKDELSAAVQTMAGKLRDSGLLLASMRDYDKLILERPSVQGPTFYGGVVDRRIVHQVWDWIAEDRYRVHMYITEKNGGAWRLHHFVGEYRAVLRNEVRDTLAEAGFDQIRWLMPEESGFYQPLLVARKQREQEAAGKRAERIG